jgi:hypothetical protein
LIRRILLDGIICKQLSNILLSAQNKQRRNKHVKISIKYFKASLKAAEEKKLITSAIWKEKRAGGVKLEQSLILIFLSVN